MTILEHSKNIFNVRAVEMAVRSHFIVAHILHDLLLLFQSCSGFQLLQRGSFEGFPKEPPLLHPVWRNLRVVRPI